MASQVARSITSTAGPASRRASCRLPPRRAPRRRGRARPAGGRGRRRRCGPRSAAPARRGAAAALRRRFLPPTGCAAATLASACIIACMRSIMAARPDGILSAARSPWPSSTPSASACLWPRRCRIWCSIESSQTRLTTVTERVWFLRQARAMRCSSFAGFHGRSTLTTALAACRLSPTLPLSVDRNSRQAGSCLKRMISARRRCCGTEPVCQAPPRRSRPRARAPARACAPTRRTR